MELKTPVTRLQECFVKKGVTPIFTLIQNGVGTHEPVFVYEVCGLGKRAIGRGKSKKEAKHVAAEELLHLIFENEMKLDVQNVHNPYSDVFAENSIGALQEFCLNYKITIPVYEEVQNKDCNNNFETNCIISSLNTTGVARTKKQAKKIAAHLMLIKLKELLKNNKLYQLRDNGYRNENSEKEKKAVERLCERLERNVKIPECKYQSIDVGFFDHIFKSNKFINSQKFNELKCKDKEYFSTLSMPLKYFEELMKEIDLNYMISDLEMKKTTTGNLIYIQIKDLNNATFLGHGPDLDFALKGASISALKWLWVMAR